MTFAKSLITITLLFIAVGLATSVSMAKPLRIIIISDNDDTLEISGIKAFDFWKIIGNVVFRHKGFAGMAEAYNAMAANGIEIQYVSGSPSGAVTDLFLRDNHFPQGILSHRTDEEVAAGLSIDDYKVSKISSIMQDILSQDPDAQFVFVGDNGEQDPVSYARLSANPAFTKNILGVFIHKLYGDTIGTPLEQGQIPYTSPAEFGLFISSLGLINSTQLQVVLKSVVQNPELAIPSFATVTPSQADALGQKAAGETDPKIKSLLNQVVQIEKNRCVGPMAAVSGN